MRRSSRNPDIFRVGGVRVLIDTDVFLWWDRQCQPFAPVRIAIADEANENFISVASSGNS